MGIYAWDSFGSMQKATRVQRLKRRTSTIRGCGLSPKSHGDRQRRSDRTGGGQEFQVDHATLRLEFGVRIGSRLRSQRFHLISIGRRSSDVLLAEQWMGWGVAGAFLERDGAEGGGGVAAGRLRLGWPHDKIPRK